jgi:hypothetical protein
LGVGAQEGRLIGGCGRCRWNRRRGLRSGEPIVAGHPPLPQASLAHIDAVTAGDRPATLLEVAPEHALGHVDSVSWAGDGRRVDSYGAWLRTGRRRIDLGVSSSRRRVHSCRTSGAGAQLSGSRLGTLLGGRSVLAVRVLSRASPVYIQRARASDRPRSFLAAMARTALDGPASADYRIDVAVALRSVTITLGEDALCGRRDGRGFGYKIQESWPCDVSPTLWVPSFIDAARRSCSTE